jgi:hypothetical protein
MRVGLVVAAAALVAAGCRPRGEIRVQELGRTLFDVSGGTTWKNHVTAVPDPGGSGRTVWYGEKVSPTSQKMSFVNSGGFFAIPDGYRGKVVLRLWVSGSRRVRVAMTGRRTRSYYLGAPGEGHWFDLELPLEHLRGKLVEGEKVGDITVWLQPPADGENLPVGSRLLMDKAMLLPD